MLPSVSADAVEGADRMSATVTASPAPAIEGTCFLDGCFFVFKPIVILTEQDSKRSERRPNREEKVARMPPSVSADAVEGADRMSATVTASPAPSLYC